MLSSSSNPIRDFFPVIFELASSSSNPYISQFLHYIFPNSSPQTQDTIDLKLLTVAIAAGIGCVICFITGMRIFWLSRTEAAFKGSFSWGMALIWYSLMCFGGFWYDNFDLGERGHFFYMLDVLGTACSSISIIAGVSGLEDKNLTKQKVLILLFGLASMVMVLGSRLAREIIYLFSVAIAFPTGVWFVYARIIKKKEKTSENGEKEEKGEKQKKLDLKKWGAISGFGATVSLIGLVTNQRISTIVGVDIGAIFWFFLGCNIAIFGLVRMVVVENNVNHLAGRLFF